MPPLLLLKQHHTRSQMMSKCGKNKEMTQDCANLGFLFLTLEVSCCLSPNVRTRTQPPSVWNKAIVIKSLILGILILKQEGTNHLSPLHTLRLLKSTECFVFTGENMATLIHNLKYTYHDRARNRYCACHSKNSADKRNDLQWNIIEIHN